MNRYEATIEFEAESEVQAREILSDFSICDLEELGPVEDEDPGEEEVEAEQS